MEDQDQHQRRASPALRRPDGAASRVSGPHDPRSGAEVERRARPLRLRRDRLGGVLPGDRRERALQPTAHAHAGQGLRRGSLGPRGRRGLCRQEGGARAIAGGLTGESDMKKEWPLWEVFIRSQHGLAHRHVGSLHAPDAEMAILNARDVYTRRNEGVSIWVVRASDIAASSPGEKGPLFDPANSKVYRHPTFYDIPEELGHM